MAGKNVRQHDHVHTQPVAAADGDVQSWWRGAAMQEESEPDKAAEELKNTCFLCMAGPRKLALLEKEISDESTRVYIYYLIAGRIL